MEIDEKYLKKLSDQEVLFSGQFLKDVFLYRKTDISLSEEEQKTVYTLLQAATSPRLKDMIINHLYSSTQLKIRDGMSRKDQLDLLMYSTNIPLIIPIFKSLPKDKQKEYLEKIYFDNPQKHSDLKKAVTQKLSIAGNVWMEKHLVNETMLENEINSILNLFVDPKLSYEDTAIISRQIEKKYDLSHLEEIISKVSSQFIEMDIPMEDAQTFLIHLKFHYFIDVYLKSFPGLQSLLDPLVEKTIIALGKLPDQSWITRVLNQFPLHTIKIILTSLINSKELSDFNKQNTYSKILKGIKNNLEAPEAANIRFAFSQI
ncbi:hypothetical protein ACFLZV_05805 [Candidatus Margulisiibacteriota bacterium]